MLWERGSIEQLNTAGVVLARIGAAVLKVLLNLNVLSNESGNFVRLIGLDSGDLLHHQIAAFHVEIQCSILGADFSGWDHLGERMAPDFFLKIYTENKFQLKSIFLSKSYKSYMCGHVEEMDAVFVQC